MFSAVCGPGFSPGRWLPPVLLTVHHLVGDQLIDGQVAGLLPGFDQLRFTNVPGVGLVIGVLLIT